MQGQSENGLARRDASAAPMVYREVVKLDSNRNKAEQSMLRVVDIADMKLSKRKTEQIITYSLGSCLGVTAYDPVAGVGAMIHCLLPGVDGNSEKKKQNPYMFVTTGVVTMVRALFKAGAKKKNLVWHVAGGADMRGDTLFFTGRRNYEALKALLEKNKVTPTAEEVGGTRPRTMSLYMDTGRVTVKTFGKEHDL